MRALVSRPEPGASATAARLRTLGHEPVVAPLFAYEAVDWAPPEDFDAVMLTSAAAVQLGGPALAATAATKQVFAVGAATAEAARAAGIVAVVGEGDITSLLPRIAASGARRVLHVRGADSTPFDPPASTTFIPAIAYCAARREWTRAERMEAEAADVVLAYSARGAAALADALAGPAKAMQRLAAISAAVATAAGEGWGRVDVARMPNEDALFAAAGLLCE